MTPASVNARATRATCSTVTPFFISASRRSDATSSPPLTATQPERASSSTSSGVKCLLEADVAPPGDRDAAARCSRSASARSIAGGAASSTKWKPVSPVSRISASMRSTVTSADAGS